MTFSDIKARLQGVKSNSDTSLMALCPAHEDHDPSLSISLSEDGKQILLHCFAGCNSEDVMDKLGLSMADLYTQQQKPRRKGIRTHTYEYHDAAGVLCYQKTRTDYDDGDKGFFFEQPNGQKNLKGAKSVPYNLPAVIEADTIYFVEGEKCAEAIIQTGRVATTLHSGAKSRWLPEYTAYFKGKSVTILPDNDKPGMEYANRMAAHIPDARIVVLPGLNHKEDIFDWLALGHTMDEVDALPTYDVPAADPEPIASARNGRESRRSQAEILLELAEDIGVTTLRDDMENAYVAFPEGSHRELWPLDSSYASAWLHRLYYKEVGTPIKNDALGQALSVLTAKALFDSPEPITLATRVASHDDALWYDLTHPEWKAVKVTAEGWEIVDNPPFLFYRYRHQSVQVIPEPAGDVRKILQYINIKENTTLFLCAMIACFIPGIPHAIMVFHGEKGSAKTTACTLLKSLIDPSALETLTLEKDQRSLAVSLNQHLFVPFDNISHISVETSDMLCRASTGGGIQQRKLFTNGEDYIIKIQKCIAINGINIVATRPDLLDRALLLELERVPANERRELSKIMAKFQEDRASILGGVLDTLSKAMAIYPTLELSNLTRMADFATWCYAIGEALGGLGQTFLNEYEANQNIQNTEAINADAVATLIVALMNGCAVWHGRISDLRVELARIAPDYGIDPGLLPRQPNGLSKRLKAIKSNLEAVGISFEKHCKDNGTHISLHKVNSSPLPPYSQNLNNSNGLQNGDGLGVNGDGPVFAPFLIPFNITNNGDDGGSGDDPPQF